MERRAGPATGAGFPRGLAFRLAALLLGGLLGLAGLELALRALDGKWTRENFLGNHFTKFRLRYPAVPDPELGYLPADLPGTPARVLAHGIRSNGAAALPWDADPAGPTLAVGDSFTWGDGVLDGETWPAVLEAHLGTPVLNSGVFGYGLDQVYLRTLKLMDRLAPRRVVLSLITDDLVRCSLSEHFSTDKPWFEPLGDGLVLRGVPVPPPTPPDPRLEAVRDVLGFSWAFHRFMSAWDKGAWTWGRMRHTWVHQQGAEVGRRLLRSLEAEVRRQGATLAVVVQYVRTFHPPVERPMLRQALGGLADPSTVVVDLGDELEALRAGAPAEFAALYLPGDAHPSPAGYRLLVERLVRALGARP